MMAPLHGLKVLDLSRLLPGGALTQLLADLGADVIKVERPGLGDDARRAPPTVGDSSPTHAFLDRGKRSVALDLKTDEGRAAVRRLASWCQVVVESFRPGVADRLGIGYEQLRTINHAIVYCSVNGYGASGPRAAVAGHDINFCAYAGLYDNSGPPTDLRQLGGAQLADITGGLLGAVGVLAAVRRADATGIGEHVEVALADAALWALGIHVSTSLGGGAAGPAATATNGAYPCYQLYRCGDGRGIAVGALESQFWARLVERLRRPDLLQRQFDPSAIGELAAIFSTRPLQAWLAEFEGTDACVGPVQSFAEAVSDPQFRARAMIVEMDGAVRSSQVGCPIKLASGPTPLRPAPATVGAHDAEVWELIGDG